MNRLRIALEWFLNPDHVPLIVAQRLGWFAEAGLEVELVEPAAHLDALAAIEEGTIDVAVTEPLHLVDDAAEGASLVGFARFLHTQGGVMYFGGRGIERPRDMAGKRLQYPGAPGPGGPAIVNTMIARDGGDPTANPVIPVNNGFYHTDALLEDKADLATLVFYNFEVIEARHRGADAHFFELSAWGVPDFCQLILITSERLLAERRSDLDALVRCLRRGVDFVLLHPEEARALWVEHTGADLSDALTRDIFEATVSCFRQDMTLSAAYYEELAAWMLSTGQIATLPAIERYWTNELVR